MRVVALDTLLPRIVHLDIDLRESRGAGDAPVVAEGAKVPAFRTLGFYGIGVFRVRGERPVADFAIYGLMFGLYPQIVFVFVARKAGNTSGMPQRLVPVLGDRITPVIPVLAEIFGNKNKTHQQEASNDQQGQDQDPFNERIIIIWF